MQKFIYKIEIGENKIRINWILDRLHYENEAVMIRKCEALQQIENPSAKTAEGALLKISKNFGSQSLTNGAQDWTRTSILIKVLPPQGSASTNFATWA